MANEIQFNGVHGTTCYVVISNSIGQFYNTVTPGFESYQTIHFGNYTITATEQGTASGIFLATMPSIAVGHYNITAYQQAGGSPAETDLQVALGDIYWTGSVTSFFNTDSNGRIQVQSGVTKNAALNAFTFPMVSSADHVTLLTGLTVTAQRSIDGGAFSNCANAVTEIGNGLYQINLAASDLNGNVIALRFTATGADATNITLTTTP